MSRLPPLRDVIRRHDLSARKGLGQHFLLDFNLIRRITRVAGDVSRGTTIEIGPGPGGLTRTLLEAGACVTAIEKDHRCLDALAEVKDAYPARLDVVSEDALNCNFTKIGTAPRRVVANLPYNIASELIVRWLNHPECFESLTVMVQKEVAERLAAEPGSKSYGRLSVLAGWRWHVSLAFDVHRKAFTPPPKVDSTVVHMTPRAKPLANAESETLSRVTEAAFGQRRKMLRSSLKPLGDSENLCESAGVEPRKRAEQITVEGFCAIARAVDNNAC